VEIFYYISAWLLLKLPSKMRLAKHVMLVTPKQKVLQEVRRHYPTSVTSASPIIPPVPLDLEYITVITYWPCWWVAVTTAWRFLRLRIEERPPISRVVANKLNQQSRTADEGWSSSLGVGRGANNTSL
jgi:hypothetical protein